MASKKGLEDFDAVIGEATPECDAETSALGAAAARPFLFYAHSLDPSRLEVVATDFHSHTFVRLFTVHDLEDLRDDIGIGGSWSEFVDYLNSSLSNGNVKLILGSSHNRDSGTDHANMIAFKSKGLPRISLSLSKISNDQAIDAIAKLSLSLFNAFKKKQSDALKVSMEGNSHKRLKVVATAKDAQVEQVESSMSMNIKRKTQSTKHLWTKQEDAALVDYLVDLSKDSAWKSENGFRTGYLLHLEKCMAAKLPLSNLKATPHIESRYKLLKRQFHAINEMLKHSSGFGWNDVEKCIITTKDVFDDWVKSHPAAIGLRNKSFPHLDDLMSVWGKDRATGANAETPADAVEEINLCDEEDINVIGLEDEESDDVNQGIRISETLDSSSIDVLGDLVGEIRNYVIGTDERISTYFMKQTESNDRKMKIYDELIELSELSQQEIMDVGEYILKDEHKVDNFFALPKIFRRDYVVKQLSEIHPK